MYYFWGYIKLQNKGEENLSVAMLSTVDPKKNISSPFKKWRFSRRSFENPRDALSWGRRLVSRYAQMKASRQVVETKQSVTCQPYGCVDYTGD